VVTPRRKPSKKVHPSAPGSQFHGLFLQYSRTHGDDDHIGAMTTSRLQDRFSQILLLRIYDKVRSKLCSLSCPTLLNLADNHLARSAVPGQKKIHQAHRSGAYDDHRLAGS
jgi:hypothetical protein